MIFVHAYGMDEPRHRLAQARAAAGFDSPSATAKAHPRDINKNTLISHENGNRALSRQAAAKYAAVFNVDAGWLLYGEGGLQSTLGPAVKLPDTGAPVFAGYVNAGYWRAKGEVTIVGGVLAANREFSRRRK